jgi:hypothetical protein
MTVTISGARRLCKQPKKILSYRWASLVAFGPMDAAPYRFGPWSLASQKPGKKASISTKFVKLSKADR